MNIMSQVEKIENIFKTQNNLVLIVKIINSFKLKDISSINIFILKIQHFDY